MPVVLFQILIVASIAIARLHSARAATMVSICWTAATALLVFMPWLMVLQLAVVWTTRQIAVSLPRLELRTDGPARTCAAIAAACLFMAPFAVPMLALAAIFGWTAWRHASPRTAGILPPIPLADVTPSTPRWREYYERVCESPAEVAFLQAMVARYRLEPDRGKLRGHGIGLEMQTRIGRYRADFVANHSLVVEIDGAKWHGSADARRRDGIRDAFLSAAGYDVLRIPAKTVFRRPARATRMVEERFTTHGRRPMARRNPFPAGSPTGQR